MLPLPIGAVPLRKATFHSGVYFFIDDCDRVAYVGMSRTIRRRIASHPHRKHDDKVFAVEVSPDRLMREERRMIAVYKPYRNKNGVKIGSAKYDYNLLVMIDLLVGYLSDNAIATRLRVSNSFIRSRRMALGIASGNDRVYSRARMVEIVD